MTSHHFNGVREIARDFEELQDTSLKSDRLQRHRETETSKDFIGSDELDMTSDAKSQLFPLLFMLSKVYVFLMFIT